jgi:hypothetical protein
MGAGRFTVLASRLYTPELLGNVRPQCRLRHDQPPPGWDSNERDLVTVEAGTDRRHRRKAVTVTARTPTLKAVQIYNGSGDIAQVQLASTIGQTEPSIHPSLGRQIPGDAKRCPSHEVPS